LNRTANTDSSVSAKVKVPFLGLKPAYDELRVGFDAAYRRVMDSGWYVLGKELEAFEAEFAAYCGVNHCVGVGNGLDALHLILYGYGIGQGDEVMRRSVHSVENLRLRMFLPT
jgi:dTDP-4-amino-4,6-dideoxygalactose transaminase